MKYVLALICTLILLANLQAQEKNDFEILVHLKTAALNDQQSSGTCWSFATTSFIEAEAVRLGKPVITLSPIFYVKPTYLNKAERYIETKGETYFGAGDLTFSVMENYKKYGAVPEEVYNGVIDQDWQHDHLEMDNLLYAMVQSIGTSGYGRIKPYSYKLGIQGVLDAYLGTPPSTFLYKDKHYTPISFAAEFVGIDTDEYLEVTSFTHIDFYQMSALDIPANWNKNEYLNIPLTDFERMIDFALENGFSLAWDGDATEPHFDFKTGIATLSEQEEAATITQEIRQGAFENGSTTDDHNMHIIGKAKNARNQIYYILKNSEGSNTMNGYIYMSKNALLLKTISVLVHQDGIPKEFLNKL